MYGSAGILPASVTAIFDWPRLLSNKRHQPTLLQTYRHQLQYSPVHRHQTSTTMNRQPQQVGITHLLMPNKPLGEWLDRCEIVDLGGPILMPWPVQILSQ